VKESYKNLLSQKKDYYKNYLNKKGNENQDNNNEEEEDFKIKKNIRNTIDQEEENNNDSSLEKYYEKQINHMEDEIEKVMQKKMGSARYSTTSSHNVHSSYNGHNGNNCGQSNAKTTNNANTINNANSTNKARSIASTPKKNNNVSEKRSSTPMNNKSNVILKESIINYNDYKTTPKKSSSSNKNINNSVNVRSSSVRSHISHTSQSFQDEKVKKPLANVKLQINNDNSIKIQTDKNKGFLTNKDSYTNPKIIKNSPNNNKKSVFNSFRTIVTPSNINPKTTMSNKNITNTIKNNKTIGLNIKPIRNEYSIKTEIEAIANANNITDIDVNADVNKVDESSLSNFEKEILSLKKQNELLDNSLKPLLSIVKGEVTKPSSNYNSLLNIKLLYLILIFVGYSSLLISNTKKETESVNLKKPNNTKTNNNNNNNNTLKNDVVKTKKPENKITNNMANLQNYLKEEDDENNISFEDKINNISNNISNNNIS